jgi:predicted DNA-binding transcriptional regulator YafY
VAKQDVVNLQFANELTDTIADRYGMDKLTPLNDYKHFSLTAKVEVNHQFYGWLCSFGEDVEITSPTWVREAYKGYLRKIINLSD